MHIQLHSKSERKMSSEYKQKKWSLNELLPSRYSQETTKVFEQLDQKVAQFESYRSILSEEIGQEKLMQIIHDLENIYQLAYRIFAFAELEFAGDTQDQDSQAFLAKVQEKIAELENKTIFFSLWWKELTEHIAARYQEAAGDYRYWLEEMRHFKPHTLSEAEEKVINIKNTTGIQALQNLYDTITNRYVYKIIVDGEEKELTRGELMVYVRHPNAEIRENAYQELYRVFGEDGPILGQMYQTVARDWKNEQMGLRKYSSPIATRNLINDIPDETVELLLDICQENASVFQRFFRLKAKWLGVEKLNRYDIYAPVAKTEKSYSYADAVDMVFSSLGQFEPKIAELAKRVFVEDHLDSEIRKGKRDGAFCMTVTPEFTPWVLINYQGKPEDVATMAHEIGHAIHSMLAEEHSLFTQQACLPLAETASTFSEMVLVDYLLAAETDAEVKRDILFRQVDDAYATILRQAYFAVFERKAHDLVAEGASVEDLSDLYLEDLQTQFGDAVKVSDEFRWEWVSIPHIFQVPFYVYAYTFGQLLVFSLYQQYKEEGKTFIPRYLEILAAGGSEAPSMVLRNAGIDMNSRDFWQGGFDVISELIEQLEKIPLKNL
jgi:oligoendopeptidase F